MLGDSEFKLDFLSFSAPLFYILIRKFIATFSRLAKSDEKFNFLKTSKVVHVRKAEANTVGSNDSRLPTVDDNESASRRSTSTRTPTC